ncbi:MAG: ferric reductase, partial [Deltaproteobacteria bacterium]|nr:ferric reductase [Deltaproteobacteria bacterium]
GRPLRCHVDGPYGTPSNHIFESRRVVLVGAGIGVTPFASILESILMRAQTGSPTPLERVLFVWLNRDAYSFEWFGSLLARLEHEDRKNLLDLRVFMTGGRADITSGALELARSLLTARGHGDIVTGLRAKTTFGSPDWDALLGSIAAEGGQVPVDLYFCGPPALGKVVRDACARHRVRFRMEHF